MIITIRSFIVVLIGLSALAYGDKNKEPYIMPDTEMHYLSTDKTLNKHYKLFVKLPPTYSRQTNKKYPTVYLLDPQWSFEFVSQMMGGLLYDRRMPEVILVGVGYAGENINPEQLRINDLPLPNKHMNQNTGAPDFLKFFKQDVIPYVENNYRVDTAFRGLLGNSFGGLFALHAMFAEPELFQGIVASSPLTAFNHRELWVQESEFYHGGEYQVWLRAAASSLNTRLYMTVGGDEIDEHKSDIVAFDKVLEARQYPGFYYEFRVVDGEHHGGVTYESYVRGMRFMFEDF